MASTEHDLRSTLMAGLKALQLDLSEQQDDQLLAYQAMIAKWTKVYNLTAVRDPAEMMTHHLLDSLAAIPALQRHLDSAGLEQGSRLLDVGSGAGLPGVVIAICCPDIHVTCIDAVAKKMAFVQQVATELKLTNLSARHVRVETLSEPFDVITSRAFATLTDFVEGSRRALKPVTGIWMAMKAKDTAVERAALAADIDVFHVGPLRVPGLDAERHLVWIRLKAATSH